MADRTVRVFFLGNADKAVPEFKRVEQSTESLDKKMEQFGQKLQGFGAKMSIGVTAPLALFGKSALDAASDTDESFSKMNVVFGESARQIDQWAQNAAKNLGVSREQALQTTGTFGNLFTSMGLGQEESAKLSMNIAGLGSDLASFNNIDPTEALDKLRAGLVGEAEPLRALGVNINAAMVEAKAMEMGLVGLNGEVTEAGKVQARYALIMEQTTNAQGDFARTSDGAANQTRIAKAEFADMSAQLGTTLVPIFQTLIGIGQTVVGFFSSLPEPVQKGIVIFGLLVAAIGPLMGVIGTLITIIPTLVGAFGTVAAVLGAPILLPIAAVVAAAIGLYLAWQTNFLGIQDITRDIAAFLTKTFNDIRGFIDDHGDQISAIIERVWDVIHRTIDNTITIIRNLIELTLNIITGDWDDAWTNIKNILSALWDQMNTIVSLATDVLRATIELAWQLVTRATEETWTYLREFISSTWQEIQAAIDSLKGAIHEAIMWPFRTANDLLFGGGGIWPSIKTGIGDAWNWIDQTLRGLHQSLLTALKWPFEQFAGSIGGIMDAGKRAALAPIAAVISAINGFASGASNALGKIGIDVSIPSIPQIAGFARGGIVRQPMVMVGEEAPQHPEFVIASNPTYRERNIGLWQQAGRSLGIPGFEMGGIISGVTGAIGAGAEAVGNIASALIDLPGKIRDLLPDFSGMGGKGMIGQFMRGTAKTIVDKLLAFILSKVPVFGGVSGDTSGLIVTGGGAFPVVGYTGGLPLHWGSHPGAIDLFAAPGTPVVAIRGGYATAGYSSVGGYWVNVSGDDGLQYYYAHLIGPGRSGRVEAGTVLGGVGETGNAAGTGAHLHLGIGTSIGVGTGPAGGAGDVNVAAMLRGIRGYGAGGWLTEPMLAVGLRTGMLATMAEREPEYITPRSKMGGAFERVPVRMPIAIDGKVFIEATGHLLIDWMGRRVMAEAV